MNVVLAWLGLVLLEEEDGAEHPHEERAEAGGDHQQGPPARHVQEEGGQAGAQHLQQRCQYTEHHIQRSAFNNR